MVQLDVKRTFMNGELNEIRYVRSSTGMDIGDHMILKLNKALYGLKQAAWA